MLRAMVFRDSEELLYSMLRKNSQISAPQLPYAMYVKGVQGKKLLSPVFKKRGPDGGIEMVAQAREAELRVDMERLELQVHMRHGVGIDANGGLAYFDDKCFPVALPQDFGKMDRVRERDMTWQQLLARRQEVANDIEAAWGEIAAAQAKLTLGGQPHDLPQHVHNLKQRYKHLQYQARLVVVEMLMRAGP